MSTILDVSTPLGPIGPSLETTRIDFDFQKPDDGAMVVVFKTYGGVFACCITSQKLTIASEKGLICIDEPIKLQSDKWYRVECGTRNNYIFGTVILYVRIWQQEDNE